MACRADGAGEAASGAEADQGRAIRQSGDAEIRIGAAVAGGDESSGESRKSSMRDRQLTGNRTS